MLYYFVILVKKGVVYPIMDDGSRSSMAPWIIAIVLLLAAAYFAVTETAIASVSRSRIKAKLERGDPRAEKAQYVLDHFDQAVTTLLICTNIVHLAAAAIVTVAVTADAATIREICWALAWNIL